MEKQVPFVYGKLAGTADFTDRQEERATLIRNFEAGINTILISPRRWGKSSLVSFVAEELKKKNKKIRVCSIDLFSVRNEADFYEQYATAVLNAGGGKLHDVIETARKFLGKFIPRIGISPDPSSEVSLGLDWQEVKRNPEEILNLPEKIAKSKGIQMVVCMDEFQNIASFSDPLAFQKKMRAALQKHKHVSYCFYGSKRHMLMDVFSNPSMPFYKFGEIIFLEKIALKYWVPFLQKRFKNTGKELSTDQARHIAQLASCHPYYTQQLAQQVWLQTRKKADNHAIDACHERLCDQFSLIFHALTDSLSATQVNYLHAFIKGERVMYGAEVIRRYRLGTSANVSKIKKALQDKEIIDAVEQHEFILDPYYEYWLKTRYFTRSLF